MALQNKHIGVLLLFSIESCVTITSFLKLKHVKVRNYFSFTFNSVTSCDIVKGKDYCFSFNLLRVYRAVLQRLTQVKRHF